MANESKLSQAQISRYRDELLLAQGGRCPLCCEPINGDAVLDHCHRTGHVRGVLHRSCNGLEGKIANWIKSFGRNLDMGSLLSSLIKYQSGEYSSNPLHPLHKTEIDKSIRKLQRAMKSAKGAETKAKHKSSISELKRQVLRHEF